MRNNRVVDNAAAGRMSYGFNITFPSAPVMEIMALAGFEFVQFDAGHGPFTPDTLDDLCRVADGLGLTPMARVPDIEDSTILRFLDRGIMGILGPHVSTREKAERLVRACKFAPLGTRSMGSGRGAFYGDYPSTLEYMEHANASVLVMAQLEDVAVLDDIDGILAVDGIDYFSSGPQDIAQSMGLPGQPTHPRVLEFEATVRDAVHAAGKKMVDDDMVAARTADMLLDGSRAFLAAEKQD